MALAIGAMAAFIGLAPGARADAAGTLTLTPTSGTTADDPAFQSVRTSAGCPDGYQSSVSLMLALPDGTEAFLAPSDTGGAPYKDAFSFALSPFSSLKQALGTAAADGDHEVRLKCSNDDFEFAPGYFAATVTISGDQWTVKDTADAVATRTTLTATPAGTAEPGAEVTLSAAVDPAAAVGKVSFLDGTTTLGETAVAAGKAELKTTKLATGKHSLTARFTPDDAAKYKSSVSDAVDYTVKDNDSTPTPTPDPTDTPPPTDPGDLTVTDEKGEPLGDNPTLADGQKVLITARGYTADATVKVTLSESEATFKDAKADGTGTVEKYEFTVPKDTADGSYTLTLAEAGAEGADGHSVAFAFTVGDAEPTPAPSDAGDGAGGVIGGGDSGGGTGTSGGASTGGGGGSGEPKGPLASTGSGALLLGVAAVACTGLGIACVRYSRRTGLLSFGARRH
ncbi:Ig-like domain-containing protein [Streptomyces milbemycinicus]|uniref:Ig-like domain-containing protein n=1 Tax=Streptomyces milbemycinicus TaxID=476552 RepID=UPI0034100BD0